MVVFSFSSFLHNSVKAQPLQDSSFSCGTDPNLVAESEVSHRSNAFCSDPNVVKYVRLAFHFILTDNPNDSYIAYDTSGNILFQYSQPGNFTPHHDGLGNHNYNGYDRAHEITSIMNSYIETNNDQRREESGVYYPPTAPDMNLQFVVSAVQFHTNSTDWNHGWRFSTNKYDYGGYDVIDVYMMPFFNSSVSGVANARGAQEKYLAMSFYGLYNHATLQNYSRSFLAGLLFHELGHTLNLHHTWNIEDDCDDTPKGFRYDNEFCVEDFANCWSFDASVCPCPDPGARKPCDAWHKISNNFMDYISYYPGGALTSCQVDLVQNNLNKFDSYIHSCNGCMPATAYFEMESNCLYTYQDRNAQWVTTGIQLNASSSWNVNEWFLEICELDVMDNCTNNSYTSPWQNGRPERLLLSDFFTFQADKNYRIRLTTNQSTCALNETYEYDITTQSCSHTANTDIHVVGDATMFSEDMGITYILDAPGEVDLYAVNTSTGFSYNLQTALSQLITGSHNYNFNGSNLPSGNYQVVAILVASNTEGNSISVDTRSFIKY